MGLGGIGGWQLLLVLFIILLLFGTKRLKGLGSDLGSAIKGFKKAFHDEEAEDKSGLIDQHNRENDIEKQRCREKTDTSKGH